MGVALTDSFEMEIKEDHWDEGLLVEIDDKYLDVLFEVNPGDIIDAGTVVDDAKNSIEVQDAMVSVSSSTCDDTTENRTESETGVQESSEGDIAANNSTFDIHAADTTLVPKRYTVDYIKQNRVKDKVAIKLAGPPRPDIKLQQKCSAKSKTKSYMRNFRPVLYKARKWLCGCQRLGAFFCFPCLIFGGDPVWTDTGVKDLSHLSEKMKKHDTSRIHLRNEIHLSVLGTANVRRQLDEDYRVNFLKQNEQVDKNRYILSRIIDCVKLCGAFELALRGNGEPGAFRGVIDFVSELDDIMKEHLTSSSAFKGTSKCIQNNILDSILSVYHTELREIIKKCKYLAVEVDGTTDVSTTVRNVMILRYEDKGIIHERFWKYLSPTCNTVEGFSDAILNELQDLHIKKDQLIAQCYDGASFKDGSITDVQAKIRSNYPKAEYIHCYAHHVNSVLEKCVQNKDIQIFFAHLSSFPTFFSQSPKRLDTLKMFVSNTTQSNIAIMQNLKLHTVETVYINQKALIECMTAIILEENDAHTISQADMLLRYLNDEKFLYWLQFYKSILPHCEILFHNMRKRNVTLEFFKNCLTAFENSVWNICGAKNDLEPALKRIKIADDFTAKNVCHVIVNDFKERFKFNSHLIAEQLFYGDMFPAYYKSFPKKIFETTIAIYKDLDNFKLRNELMSMYCHDVFRCSNSVLAILNFFQNNDLTEAFSECTKLLQILCTIPRTSIEKGRSFPTLKKIRTFLTNTMTGDKLEALTVLSIEKNFIKSIPDFNQKVIDHFALQKKRKIDLIYKK